MWAHCSVWNLSLFKYKKNPIQTLQFYLCMCARVCGCTEDCELIVPRGSWQPEVVFIFMSSNRTFLNKPADCQSETNLQVLIVRCTSWMNQKDPKSKQITDSRPHSCFSSLPPPHQQVFYLTAWQIHPVFSSAAWNWILLPGCLY